MLSLPLRVQPWLIVTLAAVLNALLWAATKKYFPAGPAVVLHYNTAIGIDFTGESRQIMTLPQIGLLALLVNSAVGFLVRKIDYQTAWTFWGIMPVIQVILIGAFYLIWQVNI